MMGQAHAATGAAVTSLLGIVPGLNLSTFTLCIAILGGAGAALVPDWDSPTSTAAFTFPPLSNWLAGFIETFSAFIYLATRRGRDAKREGGHRTLTHTGLFCMLMGVLTAFASLNELAGLIILFVMLCLGLRGLFPKTTAKEGKLFLYAMAALLPIAMYSNFVPDLNPLTLGVIVGLGSLVHNLGDCLTNSGTPLLWPMPIKGQIWYRFRTPARFSTGSAKGKIIELWIKVLCVLIIVAVFFLRWYSYAR